LGGLIAGMLADLMGATSTVFAGGLICMLSALYMARRLPLILGHIHPIYARLGIKSE
jgi:hypothetical protein